jgi:hypothetical protein
MPATVLSETLYLGLKLSELLTLIGIVIGPIIAVAITLVAESKRRKRDGQIQVMRMLLNTRQLAADPAYSIAINLVPVEFNKSTQVMAAWRMYIEAVRYRPTQENQEEHHRQLNAKQTTLIYQIMRSLGFQLSETDIQTSAYLSDGFVKRDNLYLDSLQAMCDIADAIKQQNEFVRNSLNGSPTENPPAHRGHAA